jgi:AhpD family alkylhydroperoxidase
VSRLPMRTVTDAPESTRASLIASERTNGYLPNLLRILANSPVALETYLSVSRINARSSLSVAEREAVQITAAAVHGCSYCVAGHSLLAERKAKLDG